MTNLSPYISKRGLGHLCFYLTLCLLWVGWVPYLSAKPTNEPDQEKRSMIQEVDGYAYLAEDQTLSQMRDLAFASAKRQAVQNAKSYLKSYTHVEDFVLKSDQILIDTEGVVSVLESRDLGLEDNARYHVWIKAEVEYELNTRPGQAKTPELDSKQPLTVKVWTSKKAYVEGEKVTIFLKGNRDFYARIIDVQATGEIVQLLPNDYRSIHAFKGGKLYQIPDKGDKFDLEVSSPYGEDQIVVYASEVPLPEVATTPLGTTGLRGISGTRDALGKKTRGIKVVSNKPGSAKPASGNTSGVVAAQFYEATWKFSTEPQ